MLAVGALMVEAFVAGGSLGWLTSRPSWQPVALGLAALGLLVVTASRLAALRPRPRADAPGAARPFDRDQLLFADLIRSVPDDAIAFLRDHDHSYSYDRTVMFALRNVMHEWSETENIFTNSELDHLRSNFVVSIQRYIGALNVYTYPTDNVTGRFVLPRWLYRDSKTYASRVAEMNEKAAAVVAAWEAIVGHGQRRCPEAFAALPPDRRPTAVPAEPP